MKSQQCLYFLILILLQFRLAQSQQQATSINNRYFVLLVYKSDRKQVEFTSNPGTQDLINALPVAFKAFPAANRVVLQRWSKVYSEYVEIQDGEQVGNLSKILVQEQQNIREKIKDETMLRKFLLQDYDSQVWPWSAEGIPCNVSMNINFHKILDIQLSKGTLNLLVWQRLKWVDPRLSWDKKEWSNISSLWFADDEFSSGEFWSPKVELWNSEFPIGFSLYPQQIVVSSDGEVFWSRNGQFHVTCDLQGMDSFPYDLASCVLEFGSWTYDKSRVQLFTFDGGYAMGGSVTCGQLNTAQYTLNNVIVQTYTYPPYNAGTQQEEWPVLLYKLVFARKNINYTFKIIIPQTVLTLVGFGAFWMPPSCGERIALTITIPVANAVYDLLVYEQLPESSEMVFASYFGVGCFLFSMIIVIESIIAVVLWEKKDPYFAAPWRSAKKLYLDYQDQMDWVAVIKAMDEELAKMGVQRNILRSHRISKAYRLKKSRRGRCSDVFSFVNSCKNNKKNCENNNIGNNSNSRGGRFSGKLHQNMSRNYLNVQNNFGNTNNSSNNNNINNNNNNLNALNESTDNIEYSTTQNIISSTNDGAKSKSNNINSFITIYQSADNVEQSPIQSTTNDGTKDKVNSNNCDDLNSQQKTIEIEMHEIQKIRFEPLDTISSGSDFQSPRFDDCSQNQNQTPSQVQWSDQAQRYFYEPPKVNLRQENYNSQNNSTQQFESIQIDGQNNTEDNSCEISASKNTWPLIHNNQNSRCGLNIDLQSQLNNFNKDQLIDESEDLSWLDDMNLADINSPNQVRELLRKVIHLHSEWKGHKYIKKCFDRLIKRHGLKAIENRVLQLIKNNGVQQAECNLNVKNYREEAQGEYNEKWQMLSKIVDRISQFTLFPAYILFIFIAFMQVFLDTNSEHDDPIFG